MAFIYSPNKEIVLFCCAMGWMFMFFSDLCKTYFDKRIKTKYRANEKHQAISLNFRSPACELEVALPCSMIMYLL